MPQNLWMPFCNSKTRRTAHFPMLAIFLRNPISHIHYSFLPFLALLFSFGTCLATGADQTIKLHHNLEVTIQPEAHSLEATDTIQWHAQKSLPANLELLLNPHLVIDEIRLNDSTLSMETVTKTHDRTHQAQRLFIPVSASEHVLSQLVLAIRYHGTIADFPKGSVGLRFTRPDKTTGYIGEEGVYLTSETIWYPTIPQTLSTFRVKSLVPAGWQTVTQGEELSHETLGSQNISEWNIATPSEALTLVANHFVKQSKVWKGITIATYLFPDDAALAEQYLESTIHYLDIYTQLLGPYPFSKFAVVENFFPAGIGLPSYTLLGSRIIKRGYTQPYSLGHEIVHSWFGNSIFNDFSTGNWVEGLTTYLANYYYEEKHASADTALKKRQHMFFEYNLYATPDHEYPVRQFHHKETRLDNAIGYQKTAMLFHMLRQEVGDENFFSGIRTLVQNWSGKHADWSTIEAIFNEISGKNLSWFFQQWVERTGSPSITIENAEVEKDPERSGQYLVNVRLVQHTPPYQLRLPVMLYLENGKSHESVIRIRDHEQTVRLSSPTKPVRLVIDPTFMVFRHLDRDQIPPMLNTWVTDPKQSVWIDRGSSTEEQKAYQSVLHRLRSQNPDRVIGDLHHERLQEESLLILGNPQHNQESRTGLASCGKTVQLQDDSITIGGETFEGSDIAWLFSCPHPQHPTHVISFFSGFSPAAISRVARLLFFYGWDSYLVFQNGKVIKRGLFPPSTTNLDITLHAA